MLGRKPQARRVAYSPGALRVKPVMLTLCPLTTLVLSTVRSPTAARLAVTRSLLVTLAAVGWW